MTPSPSRPSTGGAVEASLIRLRSVDDLESVGIEWRDLEARADGSFFLSWSWMGPWARLMVERTAVKLLQCRAEGRTIGLAFLTRRRVTHGRGLIRATQLQLNMWDAPGCDMIIEYNGILCERGRERECWAAFAEVLQVFPRRWDELAIRSLTPEQRSHARATLGSYNEADDRAIPSWSVPLGAGHSAEEELLAQLKKKTRQQMRQTLREFRALGPVVCERPQSLEEALAFFDEMGLLHAARWARVGVGGSFANPVWHAFHGGVIAEGFPRGEIVLTRVRVAGETVGFVYGFRWRGRFYAEQTGFKPQERNALRSGYLTHFLTMQTVAAEGVQRYDFLPDDTESYKRLLAEPEGELTTARFERRRLRFHVYRLGQELKRRIAAVRD